MKNPTGPPALARPASRSTGSRRLRKLVTALLMALAMSLGLASVASSARADDIHKIDNCGESTPYIHSIEVINDGYGIVIKVTPTNFARAVYGVGSQMEPFTWTMWHTVQGCVSGLYGTVADTVYQQLDCHRMYGLIPYFTGSTYDLEVYTPALKDPNPYTYFQSRCQTNDWGERVS